MKEEWKKSSKSGKKRKSSHVNTPKIKRKAEKILESRKRSEKKIETDVESNSSIDTDPELNSKSSKKLKKNKKVQFQKRSTLSKPRTKKTIKKESIPKKRKFLKRKSSPTDDETDLDIPPDPEIMQLIETIGKEKEMELKNRFAIENAEESKHGVTDDERKVGDDQNKTQKNSEKQSFDYIVIK